MTAGRYVEGVVLLVLIVGPVVYAAYAVRARLLAGWAGACARLSEAVIGLALLVALAQLLGVVGVLRPGWLAAACVAAGAGAWLIVRARAPSDVSAAPAARRGLPPRAWLALAAVAVAATPWVARTIVSLDLGMSNEDTLWYQMPFAARFVQEASITDLHFTHWDPLPTFYPLNSSLLHAVAILPFHRDLLSPLLNLGWFALSVLAAWCAGRSGRAAPEATLGAAVVLGSFLIVWTQAGEATNDVVALSLFMAAVALLLHADWRPGAVALAGAAAGLALGTKLSLVAPVGAMTLGVLLAAPRPTRLRSAAAWLAPLIALGGLWYLRNVLHTGSPVPQLEVALGPLELPTPDLPPHAEGSRLTVMHYLTDGAIWESWFLPGLRRAFGPAWPVMFVLAGSGLLLSVARGRARVHRMLGAVGIASVLAYAVTPQSAGGAEGVPGLFYFNLRFLVPALALGLVLLPLVPAVQRMDRRRIVMAVYVVLLAVTLARDGTWSTDRTGLAIAVVAAAAGAAALAVPLLRRSRVRPARRRLATVAAVLVTAVAAGWGVQDHYLDGRYRDFGGSHTAALGSPEFVSTPRLDSAYDWAREVHGARIGISGFYIQYPLYGADLSNRVEYVGDRGEGGDLSLPGSCREWRELVARGRYRYVVVTPRGFPYERVRREPSRARWLRSDAGASVILRAPDRTVTVFRIDRPPRAERC